MTTKPERSKCSTNRLADHRGHDLIGVVNAPAALKAKREREGADVHNVAMRRVVDGGVMNEAVDGGERHGLIGKHLAPFAEGLVGGDQRMSGARSDCR